MSSRRYDQEQLTLSGERLELRSFTAGHVTQDYIDWLNDPIVTRFSNQRFKQHDRQSCHSYLQSFAGSDNQFLAVHLKDSDQFIGTMTAYLTEVHQVVDIGIMIGNRSAWGNGFGLEAWQLLKGYWLGVRKVRKVTGGTLSCNLGMIRIMEKSGMCPDGVRTRQALIDDIAYDIAHFAEFRHD